MGGSLSLPKTSIAREGGKFGAGYIKGFAVITSGVEALGHGAWVDDHFAGQVAHQLANAKEGIKSRFSHPGMSATALSKGLGRVFFTEMSDGVLRGDLHFWESSTKGPDGDLREFLVTKAIEDPSAFGSSIAFSRDLEAEAEFELNHSDTEFNSPDEANENNYPHVRLGQLAYVDIVDSPAANPDGLFHRDEVFAEADQLLEFALGLSDTKPEGSPLGVDADRLHGFATRFLNTRGLKIVKLNFSEGAPSNEDVPQNEDVLLEEGVELEAEVEAEAEAEAPAEAKEDDGHFPNPPEQEGADGNSPGGHFSIADLDKYCDTFGETRGLAYFRSGLSFQDATSKYAAELSKENAGLRKKLELASQSEVDPLSGGLPDSKPRKGFSSKITIA